MKKSTFFKICIFIVGLFISISFFISCDKEKNSYLENSKKNECSKLINFKGEENIDNLISKLVSMTTTELRKYEDLHGYKSFGRVAEEFYESVDFESFKDMEELNEFIRNNNEFLILVENNGYLFVETPLYDNPMRYLVNSDYMYQIDDIVYKVFQEGVISTKNNNISQLKNINKFSFNTKGSDEIFNYYPRYIDSKTDYQITKDNQNICPNYRQVETVAGDKKNMNRIRVELTTMTQHYNCVYTIARPLKRTLGVYYWCSRTMRAHFKSRLDEYAQHLGGWCYTTAGRNNYNYYDSKIEAYCPGDHTQQQNVSNVHIGAVNSWMGTSDAPDAKIECNKEIVGEW